MEKTSKAVKCKKCQEKKICIKYKGINICEDCIDEYLKLKINCTVCRKKITRGEEIIVEKHIKKNFCSESCIETFLSEEKEKENMIEWLKDYYKTDKLSARIYMQIDDFKNKKNISYRWCFATLRYVVKIQGRDLALDTIGVVPYVVDECKRYVTEINERNKKARKQGEQNKTRFTDNVIKIKTTNIDKQREENINKMLIKEEDLKGVILW